VNRRRRIALVALAALVLVVLGGPLGGAWYVRARVVPRVEARLGRKIAVGGVRVGWGRLSLRGLVVDGAGAAPPFVLPLVRVRFSVLGLLGGRVEVSELTLDHPRIELLRGGPDDNVTSMIEKLREKREGGSPSRLRIEKVRVEHGAVVVSEAQIGDAQIQSLDADLVPNGPGQLRIADAELRVGAGPRLGAKKLMVAFALKHRVLDGVPTIEVEGGSAAPFRGLSLTDIAGAIRADPEDATRAIVDVHGSYGGAGAQLWNATGWFRAVAEEGVLRLRADRFKLSQLESILKGGTILNARDAEIDAHLDLTYKAGALGWSGAFHLSGLTVAHAMLAPVPVPRLGLDAHARGLLDLRARRLVVQEAVVDYRNVHATLTADVENVGRKPKFAARLQVRPLPCQTALAALPVELTPSLQGFKLTGTFSTDLHLALDLGDLDQPIDLGGLVGIEGCKVVEAPDLSSAQRLLGTFEQTVEVEPGKWLTFLVGPENPDWVAFNEISPYLVNSIMTTEDSGFFKHKGFIPSEFRSALQQNLQRGYFRLGASSITMQMVKNVLLSREKTLSRKLQELFLTWYVEHNLTKERIMEIYFNVIEFGPGIYGIGRAARHYFGKNANALAPQEAAFFSSILPNPKKRYVQYCHADGKLDAKWQNYVNRILRRVHERGRLDDAAFDQAIATPVQFDRAEAVPEKECVAEVKRLTTPTMPIMDATH
jgi:hypothetical protein